jgi:hypothetical protein
MFMALVVFVSSYSQIGGFIFMVACFVVFHRLYIKFSIKIFRSVYGSNLISLENFVIKSIIRSSNKRLDKLLVKIVIDEIPSNIFAVNDRISGEFSIEECQLTFKDIDGFSSVIKLMSYFESKLYISVKSDNQKNILKMEIDFCS